MNRWIGCVALLLIGMSSSACAGGIDHVVTYDDSGIWSRSNQQALSYGAGAAVIAGSIFADSDSRLGRTFDRSMDAMVMTAMTTTAMKYAFSRERPDEVMGPETFLPAAGTRAFPAAKSRRSARS